MSNQAQSPNNKKIYDLKIRTEKFGKVVILTAQTLANTPTNRPLIQQLVRSATSVGANYMEADGAESKKDFRHKISICKKEAKESMHWLRMILFANPQNEEVIRRIWKEAHELALIFSSITNKLI